MISDHRLQIADFRLNMLWVALLLVATGLLAGFVVVARKGRKLRTHQPLPPEAAQAWIEWNSRKQEVQCPFYFGSRPDNHIVLPQAKAELEACIFYHSRRFAFQTLAGGGEILVNGQETTAGYLRDGDTLSIGGATLLFRCS
jgi:hypothetical protein